MMFGGNLLLIASERTSDAPVNSAVPTVSSTGKVASSATGTAGTWDDTYTLTYSWQFYNVNTLAWEAIPNEVDIVYLSIGADYDRGLIRLAETATSGSASTTAYSATVSVTRVAPAITAVGTVSGTKIGGTLTHTGLTYTGDATVTRRWLLDAAEIAGAVSSSLFVPEGVAYDGGEISVEVTVSNSGGTDTDTTPAVELAYNLPTSAGDLSAATLAEGVEATAIDYAAQVTVTGDDDLSGITWTVKSGSVPTGMTRTGGLLTGTPSAPRDAAALVLTATNSGGAVDVSCTIGVTERTLGLELVVGGTWPTDGTGIPAGWGSGNSPTASVSSGVLTLARGASNNGQLRQGVTVTIGETYRVRVGTITNGVVGAGVGTLRVGTSGGSTAYGTLTAAGFLDVVATTTQLFVTPNVSGDASGDAATFGAVSVKAHSAVSVPAAMVTGNWTWADAGAVTGDQITVTVSTAPSSGGAAITSYRYRVNGGAWTAFSPAMTATGQARTVTLPAYETAHNIELQAVNSNGGGAASDTKAATPHFSTTCRFVSPSGDNADAGDYANPWQTAAKAASTATAGQTVYFRPGTYVPFTCANSGSSAGGYITFTTLPSEKHQAVFTTGGSGSGIQGQGKSYIRVQYLRVFDVSGDGIRFLAVTNFGSGPAVSHLEVLDNQVEGTGNAGVYMAGRQMGGTPAAGEWLMSDVKVNGNDITNTNFPSGGNECITLGGGCQNFEIIGNDVHDSLQFGIDCKNGVRNGVVRGNHVWNIEKTCIYLDTASRPMSNILVENNLVHDGGTVGIAHIREARRAQEDPVGIGHLEAVDGITIQNNIVYRCAGYGYLTFKNPNDNLSQTWKNVKIKFNTFFDNGGADQVRIIGIDSVASGWELVGNIVYDPGDATPINVDISGITQIDNRTTDPSFTSTTDGSEDLSLTGSINVTAGAATYTPATDYNGTTRASPADVGAIEYVA